MPNSYFQFKQFRIEQERCAQKVCTDSCVFGAWAAVEKAERILDIGTGTGLLALMAAQRSASARIEAVEIVEQSAQQARENVAQSPWHERIQVHHSAIQHYVQQADSTVDYILVNPPFYQNSMPSRSPEKRIALHDETLSFGELCSCMAQVLSSDGTAGVLLPQSALTDFLRLAEEQGFTPVRVLYLLDSLRSKAKRVCLEVRKKSSENIAIDYLVLCDEQRHYTPAFVALLGEFYLWL